jgi:OmpA-OmpF porin, OOP family
MRVKHLVTGLLVLLLGFVLAGCAGMSMNSEDEVICTSRDLGALLQSGDYRKKVDSFFVLQDASSSMSDDVEKCWGDEISKITLSRALIKCMNNNLPADFDVNAGMRVFGAYHDDEGLIYGMTKYSKAGLDAAASALTGTGGNTPIATALTLATQDLKDTSGKTAVILFSDGINTTDLDPVAAAAAMKEMYGENICIYTVITGKDPQGKLTMQQIAEAGQCGFAIDADNLHERPSSGCSTIGVADGMPDFVTAVFLEKTPQKMMLLDSDGDGVTDNLDQCPNTPLGVKVDRVGCPLDSDGDGVLDILDKCPNTPKGVKVDSSGCPLPIPEKVSITLLVEFDFDKVEVKPMYDGDIEKVANFLKAYPNTNVEMEGHTDSMGPDGYNMKLSRKRAESVKNYLVDNFSIDPARLTAVGYGETQPVATNDTKEGRQRNRRVVANIVTTIMK